ncbi:hypothetical protein [Streptomyces sp. SA15]|nr:hypothetical protein [Streptomyces sp. SA15]
MPATLSAATDNPAGRPCGRPDLGQGSTGTDAIVTSRWHTVLGLSAYG